MSHLSIKDREILRAAVLGKRDTFLPWRGAFGRTARLTKLEYLKVAGTSVMPPYTLYVITDAGRAALAEANAELLAEQSHG